MADLNEEPRRPVLFILLPMLLTFAIQRTVLHHSPPSTHVFIAGYLVHHLFWGLLLLIPTAFLLGLGIRTPWRRKLALVVLGFSSAMVLDEVIYLICTDGSGVAYRGSVSLGGAFAAMALAAVFLVVRLMHFTQVPPRDSMFRHGGRFGLPANAERVLHLLGLLELSA